MSRTISIPTNKNPFTVIINNTVYVYKGGETIEVPDDVAEAIEDALELVPKPKRYLSKFAQRVEGSLAEVDESDLEGLKTIAAYALADCDSITEITIPDSVNSIKLGAFNSCSNLSSVVIGNGVTSIETGAFDWCGKLSRVYLPTKPPALASAAAFDNINTGCVFYCKTQASLDAYKAATNWSTLTGTYAFKVEE